MRIRSIQGRALRLAVLASASTLALPATASAQLLRPRPVVSPLERALSTVETDEIEADLRFFASDELEGRDTPSRGQRIAARFLVNRLQTLGWLPGARDGWFQVYHLERRSLDRSASSLVARSGAESVTLSFGEDYFFFPRPLVGHEVAGELVFAGTGSAKDLEGLELDGKWALCRDSGLDWRTRRRNLRGTGAAGVVVTPGPDYDEEPYAARYGGFAESSGGMASAGERPSSQPTLYVSAEGMQRVLALAGDAALETGHGLGVELVEKRAFAVDEVLDLENVCAFWPGSDPVLSEEAILISAHYDHIGVRDGEIYNGADDNGSGSMGLLALAEALTQYGPMRRSVMLIWVSGEEKGLLGSEAWTEDPWLPNGARPIADINLDMIGRNAPEMLELTPSPEHPAYNGLTRLVEANAPLEGLTRIGSADDYWNRSDQVNFHDHLEIPVVFLFSDVHEDYHRPTDTADKIDYDKVRRVVRLVLRVLEGLQDDELGL